MGKPIGEAKEEMEFAVDKGEFMEILEKSLQPQSFGKSTVVRHPFGVVAIMSPWNFPVDEILLLALPSLASGNTGTYVCVCHIVFRTGKPRNEALTPSYIIARCSLQYCFSHCQTFRSGP